MYIPHSKKTGEEDIYNNNSTSKGTKGATIVTITTKIVHMETQILVCKVMCKQKKGEGTLDILSYVDACAQGK